MIPNDDTFMATTYEAAIFPSKTYNMDITNGRIRGYTDNVASMKQAIFKILNTERFEYAAYSNNYGVETTELLGMPISYVLPEIKRIISEALTWDSRIDSVDNFDFEVDMGKVHCTFTVHTIYGDIDAEKAVEI
ncbi:MAG: DUF2634 domain-containing protein [Clostridiales bacterium]|nr:DUF2634 domain-containing protein [Clostridiales bacterium]